MTIEEALEIIERVLDQGRSSKVQEIVFRQCWAQSYTEIAKNSGYEVGYIRDVGYKLWKLLSKAFGKKSHQNNFYGVLKQQYAAISAAPPPSSSFGIELPTMQVPEPKLLSVGEALHTSSFIATQLKIGERRLMSHFYGRTVELTLLKQWLCHDRCRLVALLGIGGIGKTALAAKLAEQVKDEFDFLIWRVLRNTLPVTELIAELLMFSLGSSQFARNCRRSDLAVNGVSASISLSVGAG
jgi:hypothetical protein